MDSSGRKKVKTPAFPGNEAPGFLKIVLQKAITDGEIEIPKMAVMEYDDCMAGHIILEVPDGREWPVKVTRRDGEVWLREGWPQFAKFYSLEEGCLLWFNYEGNHSHFQVHIFTKNCLGMEYSSNREPEENFDQTETYTPNGEAEGNFDQTEAETPRMRKCGGDGGMSSAHESTVASAFRSCHQFTHWTSAKEKLELKQRAYAKASSFKSDNPFFLISMQPSYIKNYLKLPTSFTKEHICEMGTCNLTLNISNKKSWPAECIVNAYGAQQFARFDHRDWQAFVQGNELKEGDACVFEVIAKAPEVTLTVWIFRAEDQED